MYKEETRDRGELNVDIVCKPWITIDLLITKDGATIIRGNKNEK